MSGVYDTEAQRSVADPSITQTTISPITGLPLLTRLLPTSNAALDTLLSNSHAAYLSWRSVSLSERTAVITKAVAHLVAQAPELAAEITEQMGRPVRYTKGEIATFEDRAMWLVGQAEKALKDESVDEGRPEGLKRVIRRAPLGVTLLVGAWNVSSFTLWTSIERR
jgi:acyl-CoA reductase-like NAD-dependent aldehyde dehydrogenase